MALRVGTVAVGLAIGVFAIGCGGARRPPQRMPPVIPVPSAPAPAPTHEAPPAPPPAPAAAQDPTASWYCYALWNADAPESGTTGCAHEKKQCGRERWHVAREARDTYGWHVKTKLCEPHDTVACFDYETRTDDDGSSCHPTSDDCERVRVAYLDTNHMSVVSRCKER